MRFVLRAARLLVLLSAVVVAAVAAVPAAALAQDEAALERRVKAAFLYKFSGYVAWPEGSFARPDSPLTIGVLGDDALAADVAQVIAGRTVDGRPLAVRRVTSSEPASGVHILFIGRSETARTAQVLKSLSAAPVLVVTESDSAFRQNAVINFVLLDGRVRFDVSLEAAERRGVKLSARLLAVANSVHGGSQ